MRNFEGTFETRKQSFIIASSICMTVPLSNAKHLLHTALFDKILVYALSKV